MHLCKYAWVWNETVVLYVWEKDSLVQIKVDYKSSFGAPITCISDADFLISDSGNESNADPDLGTGFKKPKSGEKYGG